MIYLHSVRINACHDEYTTNDTSMILSHFEKTNFSIPKKRKSFIILLKKRSDLTCILVSTSQVSFLLALCPS